MRFFSFNRENNMSEKTMQEEIIAGITAFQALQQQKAKESAGVFLAGILTAAATAIPIVIEFYQRGKRDQRNAAAAKEEAIRIANEEAEKARVQESEKTAERQTMFMLCKRIDELTEVVHQLSDKNGK